MPTQIYLIAPPDADAGTFPGLLAAVLAAAAVSALLVPRGARSEGAHRALVKAVLPVAQAQDCAVLIEGEPGEVRTLKADGLHVAEGAAALEEAVGALKPALIVGAGAVASRHDAMILAELGADYIMFGPLSGPTQSEAREMARWWAETMEIPAVLCDPQARPETLDPEGCEFVGLGESLWSAPEGAVAAAAAFAARLETFA